MCFFRRFCFWNIFILLHLLLLSFSYSVRRKNAFLEIRSFSIFFFSSSVRSFRCLDGYFVSLRILNFFFSSPFSHVFARLQEIPVYNDFWGSCEALLFSFSGVCVCFPRCLQKIILYTLCVHSLYRSLSIFRCCVVPFNFWLCWAFFLLHIYSGRSFVVCSLLRLASSPPVFNSSIIIKKVLFAVWPFHVSI